MPVILHERDHQRWLDPSEKPPGELDDLLKPYPASEMEAYPISKQVNSPKNDGPELIAKVDEVKTTLFG
jgi:putative SOS response-associated peptidase YedK